jgi:hypothetical protein
MRFYRTTLLVSTISWLMIGMHLPALHQLTHHGGEASVAVVTAMVILATIGIVGLSMLLRVPASKQPH